MKVLLIVCATILGALATPPLPQNPGYKEQNVAGAVKGQVAALPVLVTFCNSYNFEGSCIEMTITDGCYPLPAGFDNDVSSVNTHGGCVIVFDVFDSYNEACIDPNLLLSDSVGTGYIPDLGDYNFNDRISAVTTC